MPFLPSRISYTKKNYREPERVTQYYANTRWTGGGVFTWLRTQKQVGCGEASSGLGFDRLVDANSCEM